MLTALGSISTVANTIQQVEGYYPGSLSYRLNNPGNLTYASQPGATPVQVCNPTCHNFASFPTYDAGYQALENQISLDAGRGLTIAQFTAKYAPSQDGNDPTSYAAQIVSAAGLSTSDPLSAALTGSSTDLSLSTSTTDTSSTDPSTDTSGSSGILSSLESGLTDTVSVGSYDIPVWAIAGGVLLVGLMLFARRG